jgi:dihydroorotate dehydrogenase (fumarate)
VKWRRNMTDISTTYLGLSLRSPLVPSASPLSEDLDKIKRMEDAGAGAVVLFSLFEEQLTHIKRERLRDRQDRHNRAVGSDDHDHDHDHDRNPFPGQSQYAQTPEHYLNHIRKAKQAVKIPIIASLNCSSLGSWTEYAKQIQQAGADALELNIYSVSTDLYESGAQIERRSLQIVEEVRSEVHIPLAVKISPYYSSVANMAWRLENAGADALVMFNRFYQPDINLQSMKVTPRILLSTPQAMRLPLRWIAILYGRVPIDLGASGGIHEAYDVAKMVMAGASVTMLCSALLRRGIEYMTMLEKSFIKWMEEHEYGSVREMQGRMSQRNSPDPAAFERAHYIRGLQSFSKIRPEDIG